MGWSGKAQEEMGDDGKDGLPGLETTLVEWGKHNSKANHRTVLNKSGFRPDQRTKRPYTSEKIDLT